MICLDYNLNKNKIFLEEIDKEGIDKNKIEFLINAICPPGCPFRKNHYDLNGFFGKTYGKQYKMRDCKITNSTLYPNNYINNFSVEDVFNYEKNGFSNFKLEGRSLNTYEVLLNYIKYMVKPEYQLVIIRYVLDQINKIDIYDFNIFQTINEKPS